MKLTGDLSKVVVVSYGANPPGYPNRKPVAELAPSRCELPQEPGVYWWTAWKCFVELVKLKRTPEDAKPYVRHFRHGKKRGSFRGLWVRPWDRVPYHVPVSAYTAGEFIRADGARLSQSTAGVPHEQNEE